MTYSDFLTKYKLRASDIDIHHLVRLFVSEMENGNRDKPSSFKMIPTYIETDNAFLKDVPVVAIDAGGTNFRAALIKFNNAGHLEIGDFVNAKMPGLEGPISKDEFFQTIASHVKPLVEQAERIGFCFSYPTEILPNKDGRLLQFCKEVQAPEVVGQLIGRSLLETLGMPDKKIVLLNDTVATLLAGKSASFGKEYESYIGFILGTGTNTCYIENNINIEKNKDIDKDKSQIINIESGNFDKTPRSILDIAFDDTTANPGKYTFEKMISGGYFGGLCLHVLNTAALEHVFTKGTGHKLKQLNHLTTEQVNSYMSGTSVETGPLAACMETEEDNANCRAIIESLIERSAALVTANLASVVLKTNKGKSAEHPILITIEGTTFYKLHKLKTLFESTFEEYLSGDRKRFVEFAQVDKSSLVGAALAALTI